MADKGQFSIVIQAGGQSNRMGQDKALMPFLGRSLIARQVERLSLLKAPIFVVTNRPEAYAFLGLPLVPDVLPGAGPLGGLLTALRAASSTAVAVVACDMPFVNPLLLQAQYGLLLSAAADVVVPRSPRGIEPLHAVYRRAACLGPVEAALNAGERRVIAWFGAARVQELSPEDVARHDPEFLSFMNVNNPEEFRQAEALAQAREGT